MAFKMKGPSGFKQIKVEPAKIASTTSEATIAPTAVTYEKQQDIIATRKKQINEINKDINMLLKKGASEDDERILSLRNEIKRLQSK